jgi:hypothetical protein
VPGRKAVFEKILLAKTILVFYFSPAGYAKKRMFEKR